MSPNNPIDRMWKQLQDVTRAINALGQRVAGIEEEVARKGNLGSLGSGEPRSDIGPVSGYLQDVYNLAPEVLRTEHVRFDIQIQNGVVIFETEAQRIDPEFVFALRRLRIVGHCTDPAQINFCGPSVTFNVEDQGRGRGGVFLNPVAINETANHNGTYAGEIVWDGFYRFVVSASLKALWSFDPALLPGAGIYTFTASISGDVLRARTLPGGAMITGQGGTPR
jgi:hypothetical protein